MIYKIKQEGLMFTSEDKNKVEKVFERLIDFGEKIGLSINRKGSWIVKTIVIGAVILVFGSLFFIWTLLKKSVQKED